MGPAFPIHNSAHLFVRMFLLVCLLLLVMPAFGGLRGDRMRHPLVRQCPFIQDSFSKLHAPTSFLDENNSGREYKETETYYGELIFVLVLCANLLLWVVFSMTSPRAPSRRDEWLIFSLFCK